MSVASLPRKVPLTPYQRKREILRCPSGRSSLIAAFSIVPISSRFSAHQALILPDIRIRSIGEVVVESIDAEVYRRFPVPNSLARPLLFRIRCGCPCTSGRSPKRAARRARKPRQNPRAARGVGLPDAVVLAKRRHLLIGGAAAGNKLAPFVSLSCYSTSCGLFTSSPSARSSSA
jgi:hypothetical protein